MQKININSEYSSWGKIVLHSTGGLHMGLYRLIYSHLICSLLWKTLTLSAMQMITRQSPQEIKIEEVIQKSEKAGKTLFQWFSDKKMKANSDKCHLLCSSNREVSLTVENQATKNSKFEKLLGIKLDSKLNFNSHYMTFFKTQDRN